MTAEQPPLDFDMALRILGLLTYRYEVLQMQQRGTLSDVASLQRQVTALHEILRERDNNPRGSVDDPQES